MRLRAALLLLPLVACSSPPTAPSSPAGLTVVSGADQVGVAGYPMPEPVVVRVTDDRGAPMAGVELRAVTSAPLTRVDADTWITDSDGEVSFRWRMGASTGGESITVSIVDDHTVDAVTVSASGGSRPVRVIAGGLEQYCAITLDGRLGCWRPWEPDVFPVVPDQAPTMVLHSGPERFIDLAIGDIPFQQPVSACAVRTDGGVSCFHHLEGTETLTDLGGVHPPFNRIFANHQSNTTFFCALTADGGAWCWGANSYGQLGDGTTTARDVPTPVATSVRFTELALGGMGACGLDADGAAWCWGSGALGTGSQETQPVPVAVATPQRFVTIVDLGGRSHCAMTASRAWWCWGASVATTSPGYDLVPAPSQIPSGYHFAAPDEVKLASDGAGNALWWGDLYPTMDLVVGFSPASVTIPFPVLRFARAVRDRAACIDPGTGERWLCINLLWLWEGRSPGSLWEKPFVHGVPVLPE